jgi:phage-related protein
VNAGGAVPRSRRQRWRDYRTAAGRSPVQAFVDSLGDRDAAAVLAAMAEVRDRGLVAARHLRGEIWEVRAGVDGTSHRVLFAVEGRRGRVLLALDAFQKQTQKTPPAAIDLANRRLGDWRRRGRALGAGRGLSRGSPPGTLSR